MNTIFDNAIRRPMYYKIGTFSDGRARFARAPMDLLLMPSGPDEAFEQYINMTHDMADMPGLALDQDGDRADQYADRTGLGWVSTFLYVDDNEPGSWGHDTIIGQNRVGIL